MTVRWEKGRITGVDEGRQVFLFRYEDGVLVGRYRAYANWRSHVYRAYPDMVLCRGWRFGGMLVVNMEDVRERRIDDAEGIHDGR